MNPLEKLKLIIDRDYKKRRVLHLKGNLIYGGSENNNQAYYNHYAQALNTSKYLISKAIKEIEITVETLLKNKSYTVTF